MKQKFLFTTALALIIAMKAQSKTIDSSQTLWSGEISADYNTVNISSGTITFDNLINADCEENDGDKILKAGTFSVGKNGTLIFNDTDAHVDTATIRGHLEMTSPSNSYHTQLWSFNDINADGATILSTRGNLSAEGNYYILNSSFTFEDGQIGGGTEGENSEFVIKNSTLNLTDTYLDSEDDLEITNSSMTAKTLSQDYPDYGIWAAGNITLTNSKLELNNSFIAADANLIFNSGTYTFTDSNITANDPSYNSSVTNDFIIKGGALTANNSTLNAKVDDDETSNFIMSGGELNLLDGSEVDIENGYAEITGGKLNVNESSFDVWYGKLTVANAEIVLKGSKSDDIYADFGSSANDINISGSKIAMNGYADIAAIDDDTDENGNYLRDNRLINDITVSGSTVNTTGMNNYIAAAGDITLNNSTVNIAKDSMLAFYDDIDDLNNPGIAKITQKGGTLNLSGTLTADITVDSGGIINVGESAAVIDGEATFNSGSTLKISVSDNGNGSLTADKITGNKGAKLALNVTKEMEIGESAEITLLKDKISNNFTDEISNKRYKITGKDGGVYTITYENSASDVIADEGGNANNVSTGEAWDSLDVTEISGDSESNAIRQEIAENLKDLSQNDSKTYVEALTALAPEVAPLVPKTQSEIVNQIFGAVGSRLNHNLDGANRRGVSSGDSSSEAAVWVQGLYNKAKLNDTEKARGFDTNTYGTALGLEKYFGRFSKMGISYAYNSTDISGFKREVDADTHTGTLYARYQPNRWFINSIAAYSHSDYNEEKDVAGTKVEANYQADTISAQVNTGYDIAAGYSVLTPDIGLRYLHTTQDDYTDSAGQKISADDSDTLTAEIGLKWTADCRLKYNGALLRPELRIAAAYDAVNNGNETSVTLANNTAYRVEGEKLEPFAVRAEAGITAQIYDSAELALGYSGEFRDDYQNHSALISAKYKF